jgi:hypothetical protein
MSPRTATALLLSGCAALALAGLWIFGFLASADDLEDRMTSARQALEATQATRETQVGAAFEADVRAVKSRLDEETRSLEAWTREQSSVLARPTARLAGASPTRAECESAWAFDNDELRRAISERTGLEAPRPSSWPLAQALAQSDEYDARLFAKAQTRVRLQRILLLAAATKGGVPRAPMEFRELPESPNALWSNLEIRIFLRCKDAALFPVCESLLRMEEPLRMRLVGLRTEAANATGDNVDQVLLDVRFVLDCPRERRP